MKTKTLTRTLQDALKAANRTRNPLWVTALAAAAGAALTAYRGHRQSERIKARVVAPHGHDPETLPEGIVMTGQPGPV